VVDSEITYIPDSRSISGAPSEALLRTLSFPLIVSMEQVLAGKGTIRPTLMFLHVEGHTSSLHDFLTPPRWFCEGHDLHGMCGQFDNPRCRVFGIEQDNFVLFSRSSFRSVQGENIHDRLRVLPSSGVLMQLNA